VSNPADIFRQRQPVNDPQAARYLLPETEARRIFDEEIVPDLLAGPTPQQHPTVVVLLGQQGAGKSRVSAMAAAVLNQRGGFADLDSDLYKPYHPAYDELMTLDDTLMAAYTGPDGWAWMQLAKEYVREHRINAIVQETAQNPQTAARSIQQYRDAGFRVEVMALGVSEPMSNLGILSRYNEQLKDRGHGRLTVQANADASYRGIPELADLIDTGRLAEQVGVYRRGEGTARYRNSLNEHGEWIEPPAFRAGIERERTRPWTDEESADFLRTQLALRRELGAAWTGRLDEILAAAQPLMSERARSAATAMVEAANAASLAAEGFKGTPSERLAASGHEQPNPGHQQVPGPQHRRDREMDR
jgi:predicted ABC-type ATPase